VGIRTLLDGPAQVTIIGNVCPAAISTYPARLYPRERDRVRWRTGVLRPGLPALARYYLAD
jgi:hypothetical protein